WKRNSKNWRHTSLDEQYLSIYFFPDKIYQKCPVKKPSQEPRLSALRKKIGIDWKNVVYTPSDLRRGMKVELEHGRCLEGKRSPKTNVTNDNLQKTAKIARAHLEEHFYYYHPKIGLQVWEKNLNRAEKTAKKKKTRKTKKR